MNNQLLAKQNVLDFVAMKVKAFEAVDDESSTYTRITEDKILLLSVVSELKMVAELVLMDRTQQ